MIIPVILLGGSGARLWPSSRSLYPKQLLALASKHSMLQETVLRLLGFADVGDPIVVCNQEHRLENATSLPLEIIEVQSGSYLGEDDIVRFKDVYQRS